MTSNEIATRDEETAAVVAHLNASPPTEPELEPWARAAIAIESRGLREQLAHIVSGPVT